jgi:hypothetical protein
MPRTNTVALGRAAFNYSATLQDIETMERQMIMDIDQLLNYWGTLALTYFPSVTIFFLPLKLPGMPPPTTH